MPSFGTRSKRRLSGCDEKLQRILNEVIKESDFSVLCGHRGEAAQNKAYYSGHSGLKYPRSKHNGYPSRAVDIAPWPIDWNDLNRFIALSELVKKEADKQDVEITWGGDWRRLVDMPHFELK